MRGIMKKYWYAVTVVTVLVLLVIVNYFCQTSAHKEIQVDDVAEAYIYDAEFGGGRPIEGEALEELVKMFNDVSGVKREYDGEPGTAEHWLTIKLNNGESLTLQPLGGQKWHVKVSGRELTWIDEFCAENEMKDIIMYIGKQDELHSWYDDMLEVYNIE